MSVPFGTLLSVCLCVVCGEAAFGQSTVDLRLVGPADPIIPGQVFEVALRAERQSPTSAASFIAVDCIVGWNPADLRFLGVTTTGSIPLTQSYLPTAAQDYTGINELDVPADGNLLYYALVPLGQPRAVPEAGVQIVKFRFESISTFTQTRVDIIDNLNIAYPTETMVYDGVVPGVDDFGTGYPATIDQLDCNTIFWYGDADGDGAGDPAVTTTGCTQPEGFVSSATDLCPVNAQLVTPVGYFVDGDADGFGTGTAVEYCETSAPTGYSANALDCDDAAVMYGDSDLDGYGAGAMVACGGVALDTDCDDANALVHPGASEACADLAVDNDCDGDFSDAEASDSIAYFVDGDQDGFGAGAATMSCSSIQGSVISATDCDDGDSAVHPGAAERCADLAIDNDCDGDVSELEAIDPLVFYADVDGDGAGDAGSTTLACTAPTGFVDVAGDLCPTTPERVAPVAWYEDADADGAGDAGSSVSACDQPAGFVSNTGDLCPGDGSKLEPGACGCGAPDTDGDFDGNPDCFGQIATLTLVSDAEIYAATEQVVVRVNLGASGVGLRAAELSIAYDASRLALAGVSVAAGSPFTEIVSQTIDPVAGTVRVVAGIPASAPASSSAVPLVDLSFDVSAGPSICSVPGLVTFGSIGGAASSLPTTTSVAMVPSVSPLPAVTVMTVPPSLAGIPTDSTHAADAGTLLGAFIGMPVVTATDSCGGTAVVDVEVTGPDGTVSVGWPTDGMFPIGTSIVSWIATDSVLQTTTASHAITISDRQLLDVSISYFGAFGATSTRTIRVTSGGVATVLEIPVASGSATLSSVEVPVTDLPPCVTVKDTGHSIASAVEPSLDGTRWSTSAVLRQGDSNDDNLIDILDFGIFISDRGPDATRSRRSNFNADPVVNNADFTYIALGFLTFGDSCGGLDAPGEPLSRISVRELRRRGLGAQTKADLNQDGWVDMQDIALFMQRGH
jgi:hypothetical protein